jgi:hypothetical protein
LLLQASSLSANLFAMSIKSDTIFWLKPAHLFD